KAASGAGDRRPSPAEIALCAPWLEQELALVRPRVVLLLGTLAIERLWGKGPLDAVVGRSRRAADGALLIPLPHPSGASRWLSDPEHRALLEKALQTCRREVQRRRDRTEVTRRGERPSTFAPADRGVRYPAPRLRR